MMDRRSLLVFAGLLTALPFALAGQTSCSPDTTVAGGEYTSPPLLRNPGGMGSAMAAEVRRFRSVPSDGGRASVAILIDTAGAVQAIRIHASSGNAVADSIAVRTARQARFYPAYLDREPVCLWMVYPFVIPPTGSMTSGSLSVRGEGDPASGSG